MNLFSIVLFAPLLAKLVWNSLVAVGTVWSACKWRMRRRSDGRAAGISLMPMIDLLGILFAVIGAIVADTRTPSFGPGRVALLSLGLVVASYVQIFVFGKISNFIRRPPRQG